MSKSIRRRGCFSITFAFTLAMTVVGTPALADNIHTPAPPAAIEVAEEVPVAEPVAEPIAEEVAEPATEEVAEPATEEVAEPATEEVAEPATEPVTEEVAEPVAEEVAEPIAEEVAEPATEPATEEVTELVAEPVTEPIAEEVAEPVAEEVAEPATEPATEEVSVTRSTSPSPPPLDLPPAVMRANDNMSAAHSWARFETAIESNRPRRAGESVTVSLPDTDTIRFGSGRYNLLDDTNTNVVGSIVVNIDGDTATITFDRDVDGWAVNLWTAVTQTAVGPITEQVMIGDQEYTFEIGTRVTDCDQECQKPLAPGYKEKWSVYQNADNLVRSGLVYASTQNDANVKFEDRVHTGHGTFVCEDLSFAVYNNTGRDENLQPTGQEVNTTPSMACYGDYLIVEWSGVDVAPGRVYYVYVNTRPDPEGAGFDENDGVPMFGDTAFFNGEDVGKEVFARLYGANGIAWWSNSTPTPTPTPEPSTQPSTEPSSTPTSQSPARPTTTPTEQPPGSPSETPMAPQGTSTAPGVSPSGNEGQAEETMTPPASTNGAVAEGPATVTTKRTTVTTSSQHTSSGLAKTGADAGLALAAASIACIAIGCLVALRGQRHKA